MGLFLLPTSEADYQELLQNLQNIVESRGTATQTYDDFLRVYSDVVVMAGSDPSTAITNEALSNRTLQAVKILTIHTGKAFEENSPYLTALLEVLAVATREHEYWRFEFGRGQTIAQAEHKDACLRPQPDCILEIARRVLAIQDSASSSAIQSAVKIIGNCCADNNVNRNLIIRRDGIGLLLKLATKKIDPDALVLALYNTCIDYDEPPSYAISSRADNSAEEEEVPTYATEQLAAANRAFPDATTFEVLLTLQYTVSEHVKSYIASLVELATRPALDGFQHVRPTNLPQHNQWAWSFSVEDKDYDTVSLTIDLGSQDLECLVSMSRGILNLLSQQVARNALLTRNDDSLWRLLTMCCLHEGIDRNDDAALVEQLKLLQKEFLKIMYQITSQPEIDQDSDRASALIQRSSDQLLSCVRYNDNGSRQWDQCPPNSSQAIRSASACVILSQLSISDSIREHILDNGTLQQSILLLLTHEQNPDVLYPAVTIISRTALFPRQRLQSVQAGVLQIMRRLLTGQALGLLVPFETVTAYKTICRGRPAVSISLFQAENNASITADILALWDHTMEATTRVEIGKLFLEILRTILPIFREDGAYKNSEESRLMNQFEAALRNLGSRIAEVFAWLCIAAEPLPQRDHGWFGLAMLSVWTDGRRAILQVLEQHEFTDAAMKVSQFRDGPVPSNLKLMLSNLQKCSDDEVPSSTRDQIESIAESFGLILSFRG